MLVNSCCTFEFASVVSLIMVTFLILYQLRQQIKLLLS